MSKLVTTQEAILISVGGLLAGWSLLLAMLLRDT